MWIATGETPHLQAQTTWIDEAGRRRFRICDAVEIVEPRARRGTSRPPSMCADLAESLVRSRFWSAQAACLIAIRAALLDHLIASPDDVVRVEL